MKNLTFRHDFKQFSPTPSCEILVIGHGPLAGELARRFRGCDVTGCDPSERQIDQTRVESGLLANLYFEVQSPSRLSYPDACFDHIVLEIPLETFEEGVSELDRVLKAEGQLWFANRPTLEKAA